MGLGLQILATPRSAGPGRRATAEQPTEQVADVGTTVLPGLAEQIVEIERAGAVISGAEAAAAASAAVEAATEAAAGEHPAGFVVLLALGLIEQDVLSLADGFVPFLGRGVIRVAVGMILGEQLAGDPLDLILFGIRGDAEHLIKIFFNPFPLNHAASPPRRGY